MAFIKLKRWPFAVSLILACFLISFSLAVMWGWETESVFLVQGAPNSALIYFNIAFCALLSGLGILGILWEKKIVTRILAFGIAIVSALTIFEYVSDQNLGIDTLLINPFFVYKASSPGRMALNTAICFLLTAGSLFAATFPRQK